MTCWCHAVSIELCPGTVILGESNYLCPSCAQIEINPKVLKMIILLLMGTISDEFVPIHDIVLHITTSTNTTNLTVYYINIYIDLSNLLR